MALHMNVDKWVPALKPFWDRGMNSWRKTDLITEASTFTGLSTVDVKVSYVRQNDNIHKCY